MTDRDQEFKELVIGALNMLMSYAMAKSGDCPEDDIEYYDNWLKRSRKVLDVENSQ